MKKLTHRLTAILLALLLIIGLAATGAVEAGAASPPYDGASLKEFIIAEYNDYYSQLSEDPIVAFQGNCFRWFSIEISSYANDRAMAELVPVLNEITQRYIGMDWPDGPNWEEYETRLMALDESTRNAFEAELDALSSVLVAKIEEIITRLYPLDINDPETIQACYESLYDKTTIDTDDDIVNYDQAVLQFRLEKICREFSSVIWYTYRNSMTPEQWDMSYELRTYANVTRIPDKCSRASLIHVINLWQELKNDIIGETTPLLPYYPTNRLTALGELYKMMVCARPLSYLMISAYSSDMTVRGALTFIDSFPAGNDAVKQATKDTAWSSLTTILNTKVSETLLPSLDPIFMKYLGMSFLDYQTANGGSGSLWSPLDVYAQFEANAPIVLALLDETAANAMYLEVMDALASFSYGDYTGDIQYYLVELYVHIYYSIPYEEVWEIILPLIEIANPNDVQAIHNTTELLHLESYVLEYLAAKKRDTMTDYLWNFVADMSWGLNNMTDPDAEIEFYLPLLRELKAAFDEEPLTVPPTITGPTSLNLTTGYAAQSTGVFTVGGSPVPTVTLTGNTGGGKITWNSGTSKLDIAAGLAADSYPVTLTATNSAGSATANFTLTVTPSGGPVTTAPTITGPMGLELLTGYAATSTGAYTVGGSPAPSVTINNNYGGKITWNSGTNKLDIAAGLAAGTYPVTLTATNSAGNATASFTLTVTATAVAPTITSANSTTVVNGAGGTFQVVSSGTVPITYSLSGTVPTGVTINNTTGLISIASSTAVGVHSFTVTAANSVNSATQSFTLTVTAVAPTNKDSLNDRITAVDNTQKGKYTDASWNAYQTALTNAREVANNANATQGQVDAALNALNIAYGNLAERILYTQWPKTTWNWIKFFVLFGWIWMAFIKP